ncbi:hypothetical protein VT85_14215 [Planctomyces sp. SH-PL62]|nr:hypothetical protein VT85_14215 [Planctomyces sp. SH-PL62]
MTAEFRNRTGVTGSTAELFVGADENFLNQTFTLTVTYADGKPGNPDDPIQYNRKDKPHRVTFTVTSVTSATAAMPAVANANQPQFQAYSEPQDLATGKSRIRIVPGSLPTTSAIVKARLGNQHGTTWDMDLSDGNLYQLKYDAGAGRFDFLPVRDERGSNLTLVLTFADGKKAFARFAGVESDINRRYPDSRIGETAWDVNSAASLISALNAQKPLIQLQSGSYTFNGPLTLNYPVRIKAAPGVTVTLTFALNNTNYGSAGAFVVNSSHVALDGFAIRFQGYTDVLGSPPDGWAVIRGKTDDQDVDVSITNLDVEAPRPGPSEPHQKALDLMHFDDKDSGVISGNVLKGGSVVLGHGPWLVADNKYLGAVARTTAQSFLAGYHLHDVVIRGNDLRQEEAEGYALRFFSFGSSDHGRWFNLAIENNKVRAGIGNPPTITPRSGEIAPRSCCSSSICRDSRGSRRRSPRMATWSGFPTSRGPSRKPATSSRF